ncbi:TlpA family protein disulfide reductase [Algoriphagus sp.]|uniref:TlpA family protein disulfide reductase n=1 Tax=Algoriphagus sp. TaxID=1872435 RepID=UPI003F72FAC9
MKKLILICLVGLLCLPTSTLTAQVADSPGAGFLHRSRPIVSPERGDTHRGGETRSDTLDNTIDARVDESMLLHLEIPAAHAPDTLWLTYWHHLLKEHEEVTPGITIPLVADQGNFFEGSVDFGVYRWVGPKTDSPMYFSLRDGKHYLAKYWAIFPEDQVRIRFDTNTGKTLIGGPSSDFFKAQEAVDRLVQEESFNASPLMVTSDPARMMKDSLTAALYQQSLGRPEPVSVRLEFITPDAENQEYLLSLLRKSPVDCPVIQAVSSLQNGLDSMRQAFIEQRAWAGVLNSALPKLKQGRRHLESEPYLSLYKQWLKAIPLFNDRGMLDPMIVQAKYDLLLMEARQKGGGVFALAKKEPTLLRDMFVGKYVLENYKYLESDQKSVLISGMDIVQTPWIMDLLVQLEHRSLKGTDFYTGSLTDSSGNPFPMGQLEDKTVVMSFWVNGCKFCMRYYQHTLKPVFEQLKDDPDVVFVTVNADNRLENWENGLRSGRYVHPDMINLHEEPGTGILDYYKIASFPQKLFVDADSKLLLLTRQQYSPEKLAELIREMKNESPEELSTLTP